MPAGAPASVASQVVRRSPSAASQATMRSSSPPSSPGCQRARSEASAPESAEPATRTSIEAMLRNLDSGAVAGPVDLTNSQHARLQPLAATIDGGLWAERRRLNREVLLVEGARKLEEAGNFHNLRVAAGQEDGEFIGMRFAGSHVHKWLEGPRLGIRAEPPPAPAAPPGTPTAAPGAGPGPSG